MHQNYDNLESEFLQYASIVELIEGQEMSIAGVKNTIDILKTFLDAKDAKSMRAITALDIELSNLETELASKNRELIAKDDEIAQLKRQLTHQEEKPTLIKAGNYWYLDGDIESPICKACFDSKAEIRTLNQQERVAKRVSGHKYICPHCKTTS